MALNPEHVAVDRTVDGETAPDDTDIRTRNHTTASVGDAATTAEPNGKGTGKGNGRGAVWVVRAIHNVETVEAAMQRWRDAVAAVDALLQAKGQGNTAAVNLVVRYRLLYVWLRRIK